MLDHSSRMARRLPLRTPLCHRALWWLLSIQVCGCGGKADDELPPPSPPGTAAQYCTVHPEDSTFCDEDQTAVVKLEDALSLAPMEEDVPSGAFLVIAHGGDLAPDGRSMAADGAWELTYAIPDHYPVLVTIEASGRITTGNPQPDWACVPSEAIDVGEFAAHIRQATTKLEEEFDVAFEPGTFFLAAEQQAACASASGHEVTLVHAMTDRPVRARHTVELSEQHPDGLVCDLNLTTSCSVE